MAGGASASRRKQKENRLIEAIRSALEDEDDEDVGDEDSLFCELRDLMKKIEDDPKRNRTLRDELRGILDKFDKDASAERHVGSSRRPSVSPSPAGLQSSAKQSFYNANLWKKDRAEDKEQKAALKTPRILWQRGEVVGWGNFLRLLEEGIEVEGKTTVCYRKQAKDMWALAALHSLQKQATLLVVDDGEGPPQEAATLRWLPVEGGLPRKFSVCGLQKGEVNFGMKVAEAKVAGEAAGSFNPPAMTTLRLCAAQCFMDDWKKLNDRPAKCLLQLGLSVQQFGELKTYGWKIFGDRDSKLLIGYVKVKEDEQELLRCGEGNRGGEALGAQKRPWC